MKVKFIAESPREKARPILDEIIQKGVDQVAIACAFCTRAGVELLIKHRDRLRNSDSFVTVSWEIPTDFQSLEKLHAAAPGHLYVHLGSAKPVEIMPGRQFGRPIMHSKTFYARDGSKCWLWTGSHNLTASANQGINCEAAILLEGNVTEQPFVDAMKHLVTCRNEAIPFKTGMQGPPDSPIPAHTMLIIYAEAAVPVGSPPWHVQLRLPNTFLDSILAPPGGVRLYLCSPGALASGWQNVTPTSAFGGTITGLNYTQLHPRAAGVVADYAKADFVIDEIRGVPVMRTPTILPSDTRTQCIFRIEETSQTDEVWLGEKPKAKIEKEEGAAQLLEVDEDMREFFEPSSRRGSRLVFIPFVDYERTFKIPQDDIRKGDIEKVQGRLKNFSSAQLKFYEKTQSELDRGKHPFIFRKKYRL